ncbi:Uncharacterised protein [Mycobacteroides abscessus subsp. bolletii]|nr:Uncharacterised protein [Mycobacteroides abscessus subsp. bolletii]
MRPHHLGRTVRAIDAHGNPLVVARQVDTGGIETEGDSLTLQNFLNDRRRVGVFTLHQPGPAVHHGDLAAEPPVDLCEFQADVAAADHHEMLRYPVVLDQ